MRHLFLVPIFLFMWGVPSAAAQSSDSEISLEGLPGVHVDVFISSNGLCAVSEESVQTAVELSLRRSGISVLSRAEWLAAPRAPRLTAHVQTVETYVGCAFSLQLYLSQEVVPVESRHTVEAITWTRGYIGTGSASGISDYIRERAVIPVEEFANDFLKANPEN